VIALTRDGLVEALEAAAAAGWELDRLLQAPVEVIYANFDDAFEAAVLGEFQADPNYLIDLGPTCPGTCPLCGHHPIRWVFRVKNLQGGKSVECGSECILTYGINVMGAESAEHARLILEGQIRKAMRRLEIAAWHKATGFEAGWFQDLYAALDRVRNDYTNPNRRSAWYKRSELRKLERFYNKSGWLGTKDKWMRFRVVAHFARVNDDQVKGKVPFLTAWVDKAAQTAAELEAAGVKTAALAPKNPASAVRPVGTLGLPLFDAAANCKPVAEPVADEPVTPDLDPELEAARAAARDLVTELRSRPGLEPEAEALAKTLDEAVKPEPAVDLVGNLGRGVAEVAAGEIAENAEAELAHREALESPALDHLARELVAAAVEASKVVPRPAEPKAPEGPFEAIARELVFGK
jgi:hypothetical protein